MTARDLSRWLALLETRHPQEIDLGLARVGQVARSMSLIPAKVPIVTVAGTNGKGSVVAVLEALLLGAGFVPGVYTSPHLLRYNERIRVAGRDASDEVIVGAFEAIETARQDISLTYFEFATLAALWVARKLAADILVLEVGLGGRLDAVNILDADVTVITSIALDHQQWLGDTRELIGIEKAGITRAGKPCVVADPSPPENLLQHLTKKGVPWLHWGKDFYVQSVDESTRGQFVGHERRKVVWSDMPAVSLQPENVAAAIQACLLLGVELTEQAVIEGLHSLTLSGRQQSWDAGDNQYWLDVAHNPAAVRQLVKRLSQEPCTGRTLAVFAAMADKDIRGMIRACSSVIDQWFLAGMPEIARAATATELAAIARELCVDVVGFDDGPELIIRRARESLAAGDRLVVFGSFVLIAEGLRQLSPPVNSG